MYGDQRKLSESTAQSCCSGAAVAAVRGAAARRAARGRRSVTARRSHSPHLSTCSRSHSLVKDPRAAPADMPANDTERRGAAAWLRRWWRALVAELLSTALLILLGVASLLPVEGREPPLTHPALAFGLVVMANIEAFGAASGAHMNPAVSLAALLLGRLPAAAAAAYALAQLLGGTLGFGLLMLLAPATFAERAACVGGSAAGSVAPPAAAAVEALLTAVLVLVCCAAWSKHDAGHPDPGASIKIGLTITAVVYAGGAMSGASVNPARSFGPAVLQTFRSDHWVYWVGPLVGSALAALLYRAVLRPAPAPRASTPHLEDLPLHDKQEH